jgi:cyclic pyranopterin phosphate synthase
MVDVGDKPATVREARAGGVIRMQPATLALLAGGQAPKGDVLTVARVAGIQAAKRTAELIPLCHQVPLAHVEVWLALDDSLPGVRAVASARTVGATGVEMEALTAASIALLTVYDMLKAVDRGMTLGEIRVLAKSGGRSGSWTE